MKKQSKTSQPTFETVWAALQETDRILTEKFAETALLQKENERIWKEQHAETERIVKETSLGLDKLKETFGGWGNNLGYFAEEYFMNSFKKGEQNFFGEKFDEIKQNRNGMVTNDEYDILLINGRSVCIIETKFKAHVKNIPKLLNKAITFRLNFPQYQNYRIYLGMASLSFYDLLEEECKENGIAIIKQVGDKVVIIDEGLKTY